MALSRIDRIANELLNIQRKNGNGSREAAPDRDFMDSADLEQGWRDDDNSIDNRELDDDQEHSLVNKDQDDDPLDEDDPDDDLDIDGLDLDNGESDDHMDLGKIRKARLKLLAGMIWAYLGEPEAVVEEVAPNEISIKVQDLSWKVTLDDDSRVKISGFDSGAEQFVGKMPHQNAESMILKISKNVHQLVSEDIDKRSVPPEPPAHFGPEDTSPEESPDTSQGAPPAAPEGDQGVAPEAGAEQPLDLGMAAPAAPGGPGGAPAAAPAAPAAPGGPGGAPPPPGPGQQQPFPPMAPAASRRRVPDRVTVGRRRAHARLDEVGAQLRDLGDSLGEDGAEVFERLADRVDRVLGFLEQDLP